MTTAPQPAPDLPEPAGQLETLGSAVLRPVRGHHAFEACVEQLGTAIRLGGFPHGSTLPPERELAERLSVSRATLREAMAALREAGMVTTRRGRHGGTFVCQQPRPPRRTKRVPRGLAGRWLDALDFRRIVEPGAAGLAAARDLTTTERAALLAAHTEVAAARRPAEHRQADSRFHLTLATVTGSRRTLDAVTEVQAALHDMLCAIPVLETNIEHSDAQHARILAAVLAGDASRARRVMEQHCDDTAALLRGLIA